MATPAFAVFERDPPLLLFCRPIYIGSSPLGHIPSSHLISSVHQECPFESAPSRAFKREKIWSQKALGVLLTTQRVFKREKYGLKRGLTYCLQLREHSREKDMYSQSQGSWPLAHSSESAQDREIWGQKALGLLLTAQRAFKRSFWTSQSNLLVLVVNH